MKMITQILLKPLGHLVVGCLALLLIPYYLIRDLMHGVFSKKRESEPTILFPTSQIYEISDEFEEEEDDDPFEGYEAEKEAEYDSCWDYDDRGRILK
jgi:hypothetical protein